MEQTISQIRCEKNATIIFKKILKLQFYDTFLLPLRIYFFFVIFLTEALNITLHESRELYRNGKSVNMPISTKYNSTKKNASFPERKHFDFKYGNGSGMTS
jgi:hypothetical protein